MTLSCMVCLENGAPQKVIPHRLLQGNIFWPVQGPHHVGPVRHLEVHFVPLSLLCSLYTSYWVADFLLGLKLMQNTASDFRKPHLKSGNSSNTSHSCNAEFKVCFYTIFRKYVWWSHILFTEQGLIGLNTALSGVEVWRQVNCMTDQNGHT